MTDIKTKSEFRAEAKAVRRGISQESRMAQSKAIANMITGTELYENARYILTYISYGTEVDTRELITRALKDQKKVYAPRVMGNNIEFFEITDLSGLKRSAFGILEPNPDPEKLFPYTWHLSMDRAEECVFLVPGLAFDAKLHRIGYGGGYYDRFLSKFRKKMTIGLAFKEQIVDEVPTDETDEQLDLIVTCERAYF